MSPVTHHSGRVRRIVRPKLRRDLRPFVLYNHVTGVEKND